MAYTQLKRMEGLLFERVEDYLSKTIVLDEGDEITKKDLQKACSFTAGDLHAFCKKDEDTMSEASFSTEDVSDAPASMVSESSSASTVTLNANKLFTFIIVVNICLAFVIGNLPNKC